MNTYWCYKAEWKADLEVLLPDDVVYNQIAKHGTRNRSNAKDEDSTLVRHCTSHSASHEDDNTREEDLLDGEDLV